jgi:lipopolysaccharide/colanic/teichoic acid biosynthesis glycosyltransferase
MTSLAQSRGGATLGLGNDAAKRVLDIAAALALIAILAPVLAVLAALVRITSAGPALFRQERLGIGGRRFKMLKLRTMYLDNDDRIHRAYVASMLSSTGEAVAVEGRRLYKLEADPRVTTLGAFLRRTSLDELPQLFNVLRGEMSLVGPRPVLPWEAEMFAEPYQRRFSVKPGITGLWQVSGRSRLSMQEALDLDIEYVARRSFVLDLLILFRTIPAVCRGGAR